jgi:LmbE family N-acetylglucosaminyl deacetylase
MPPTQAATQQLIRPDAPSATDERSWRDALDGTPFVDLPAGRIVVVAPHPDDESLGAGGLVNLAARLGRDIRVVACTDGEAAYPGHRGLAERRGRELFGAVAELGHGRHVEVVRLGLPDGGLSSRVAELATRLRPDCASADLVVAPWRHDGHPDHAATAEACALAAADVPRWEYPVWAWHWASPSDLADRDVVRLRIDAVARAARRRAIRRHRSQLGDEGPPILTAGLLAHVDRPFETFVRVG